MTGFTRHRRSQHLIATFSGFEADLLRSLAAQLVELLHNEAAVPRDDVDPLEALMAFSGPPTDPDNPVLGRPYPTAYRHDEDACPVFRPFTYGTLRHGKANAANT